MYSLQRVTLTSPLNKKSQESTHRVTLSGPITATAKTKGGAQDPVRKKQLRFQNRNAVYIVL